MGALNRFDVHGRATGPEFSCAVSSGIGGRGGAKGLLPSFDRGREERLETHGLDHDFLEDGVVFDLTVGDKIYGGECILNSIPSSRYLDELVEKGRLSKVNTEEGSVVLEPDKGGRNVYYVVSKEWFRVPRDLELRVDSRSRMGRLFSMTSHRSGFNSNLNWAGDNVVTSVQPFAFPLKVNCGKSRLAQAYFRYSGSPFMGSAEIVGGELVNVDGRKVSGRDINERGVKMTYDTELVFEAKKGVEVPIDVDAVEKYNWEDFFRIVNPEGGSYILPAETCALLGTRESIGLGNALGILSRETEETGTGLWGHFAGMINPGFRGKITMEARSPVSYEICRGMDAGYVCIEGIDGLDSRGANYESDFQDQNVVPLLPPMFKGFKELGKK